jgi:hypothetical protein
MHDSTEIWEIHGVQYIPNTEQVQITGEHRVRAPSGTTVRGRGLLMTTQAALVAHCQPGDPTWGDEEVAAEVTAQTGAPAGFLPSHD